VSLTVGPACHAAATLAKLPSTPTRCSMPVAFPGGSGHRAGVHARGRSKALQEERVGASDAGDQGESDGGDLGVGEALEVGRRRASVEKGGGHRWETRTRKPGKKRRGLG
jgi:hypothetical protein